ncbi:hypothetical protein EMMF5_003111 [Cystobasidiomycetes sp. EMM_F5]
MFGNYIPGAKALAGQPKEARRVKGAAPPSKFSRSAQSGPKGSADVRCQNCLKMGHYSYECKNPTIYKSRPSRTQQLLNPKKRDKPSVHTPAEFGGSGVPVTNDRPLAIEAGLAGRILKDKKRERKSKTQGHFAPRIDERHFIMAPRAYDWPSPYIDNLIDGEEVYNARHRSGLVTNGLLRNAKADGLGFSFQRLILVSGRAGPVQITFDGCINVESVCDGSVEPPHLPQQWPVTDSYFKALVPLSPGINRLRFLFEAPDSLGGYSRNDTGTDLTVTYVPLTQNPPLHLVILAAHDSPLTVDCPPERRPGHEKIEATIAKFQLWSQLSQAFTAEQMRRNGLGRRTFALEEQSGPDSLDAFPPRHNRRRPVVHVIRSRHSLSEFRDPDVAQQNPKAARAQALHQFATEAIQSPDAPACFRNPNGSYVAVLLLDAHWDSRNRLLLGHAALGAGGPISPHPKIGVFGSHSCWSWPRTLDEVVPAFMDTSEVDERFVVNDLGNVGTAWETLNVGHGAMDDKENHWHRMSLMRLRYHPTMRLPRDPQIPYTYDAIAPSFSVIDDGVVVTGAVGLGSIEVQVDGSYRKHVEFPFCGRQSQPPPQTLRLTTAEITKLIDRDPGSCKVTIEAIGTDQRQAEIQDFGALCRGSRLIVHITSNDPAAPIPTASVTTSSKLKQSLGRLTHRDSPSGNASCPIPIVSHGEAKGPDQLQVIKGIPVGQEKPQNPAFMVVLNSCQPTSPKLVKVDIHAGFALDGFRLCWSDGSKQTIGPCGGGSVRSFDVTPPSKIVRLVVRSGLWMDAVSIVWEHGQTGLHGGGGGEVRILDPAHTLPTMPSAYLDAMEPQNNPPGEISQSAPPTRPHIVTQTSQLNQQPASTGPPNPAAAKSPAYLRSATSATQMTATTAGRSVDGESLYDQQDRVNSSLPSRRLSPPKVSKATAARRPSVQIQRLPSAISLNSAARNAAAATQSANRGGGSLAGRDRAVTIATPGYALGGRGLDGPRSAYPRVGNNAPGQNDPIAADYARQGPMSARPADQIDQNNGESTQPASKGFFSFKGTPFRKRAATTATAGESVPAQSRSRAGSVSSQRAAARSPLSAISSDRNDVYGNNVADLLDVLDPEVQALNTLGDIQNTWFIPNTGLFDRTRKIQLTKPPSVPDTAIPSRVNNTYADVDAELSAIAEKDESKSLPPVPAPPSPAEVDGQVKGPAQPVDTSVEKLAEHRVVRGEYFVLSSKIVDMSDWTEQEQADLDDYVRHLMHSRKEKLRRNRRAFGKYVRTPLGCFITVYASLLTFWGAAWVLFLIGWLPAGDRQAYFVEICDQILVALFCITGLGLIPFRIRDTYNAYFVIKYHKKTLKLREKRGLPPLSDRNELPNSQMHNADLQEAGHGDEAVLSDEEQEKFTKHQIALNKSHCILIAVGNRLTRKTEVVEALLRQAITEEAIARKEDAERYRAEKRMEAARNAGRGHNDYHRIGTFPQAVEKLFQPRDFGHQPTPHDIANTRHHSDGPTISQRFASLSDHHRANSLPGKAEGLPTTQGQNPAEEPSTAHVKMIPVATSQI